MYFRVSLEVFGQGRMAYVTSFAGLLDRVGKLETTTIG
jgi:hypothetical protein